jgi:hypothetical protein
MPDTFTFRESCELLQINPKSFQAWLKKANIDSRTQVNKADPRKKFLTRDQLMRLAEEHGRTLPLFDEEEKLEKSITIEMLAKQLAAQQQQNSKLLDEINHALIQIMPLLQEIASKNS